MPPSRVWVSRRAHGFLVAGLAEQALADLEGDREDLQPQLVDQVVLDQRAYELKAAGDDDVPVYVLLQRRDLVKHVALEDCRSEEHTSELQSHLNLVCRLLLEKKKKTLTRLQERDLVVGEGQHA